MVQSFDRVGAVVGMRVRDYCPNSACWWLPLHKEGGKFPKVSAHHRIEVYADSHLEAFIAGDGKDDGGSRIGYWHG